MILAYYFAKKKYDLTLISRNLELLSIVKQEIVDINTNIHINTHSIDLSDFTSAYTKMLEIVNELNSIDILIVSLLIFI